jgi:hypothetical protein
VIGVFQARELYRSSSGDRWDLVREPGSGRVLVRHRPNAASGGRASEVEVGEFLARGGRGPEHAELLRLIGTLVSTLSDGSPKRLGEKSPLGPAS